MSEAAKKLDKQERDKFLLLMGKGLSQHLPEFYGSVQFNVQGGKFVDMVVEERVRAPKE